MDTLKLLGAIAALSLLSSPGYAHHGTAGSYDGKKIVTIEGTVKEFRWRNPHSALFVDSKDASGKPVTYALEMGSPNTMVKFGYTSKSMKPGDKVVVEMHPSFATPTNGYAPSSLKLAVNGKAMRVAGPGEPQ